MFNERTSVGLDVHARSVVAEAVDWSTGQVFSERLVPANEVVVAWVRRLPGPVAVTYEAGPTGFGLARAFTDAGIRCEVVAPSKLERPPGDRVKTDRGELAECDGSRPVSRHSRPPPRAVRVQRGRPDANSRCR